MLIFLSSLKIGIIPYKNCMFDKYSCIKYFIHTINFLHLLCFVKFKEISAVCKVYI